MPNQGGAGNSAIVDGRGEAAPTDSDRISGMAALFMIRNVLRSEISVKCGVQPHLALALADLHRPTRLPSPVAAHTYRNP